MSLVDDSLFRFGLLRAPRLIASDTPSPDYLSVSNPRPDIGRRPFDSGRLGSDTSATPDEPDTVAIDPLISTFATRLYTFTKTPALNDVEKIILNTFGMAADPLATTPEFGRLRALLGIQVLAFHQDPTPDTFAFAQLLRNLRACELIQRMAEADPALQEPRAIQRFLRSIVILPEDETRLRRIGTASFPLKPLFRSYNNQTGDHFYTLSEFERNAALSGGYVSEGIACYLYANQASGTTPLYRLLAPAVGDHFYTTSSAERDTVLAGGAYSDEGIAGYVLPTAGEGTTPLYRLYTTVTSDHFYTISRGERDRAATHHRYASEGIVGHVYPLTLSAGAAHVAGVMDLLVVRQTLRRYERGEIAHIENVLKGEKHRRTFRHQTTTEISTQRDKEKTVDDERDLQSTDRFEMKSEVNKTVHDEMEAQGGFTVSGSYGSVTASANGQFGYQRSLDEATKTASTYAHDMIEKTRTRTSERTLERRTTQLTQLNDETAVHEIKNTADAAQHVVGVYRWVNKTYDMQILNYGRRLMLEFSIPEPAAFFRTIEERNQLRGLTRKKPEPPMLIQPDGAQKPLQAINVTWPEISALAAQYGANGITPPPPAKTTIGETLEVSYTDKDNEKEVLLLTGDTKPPALGNTKSSKEVKIPSGYEVEKVTWSGYHLPFVRKYFVTAANFDSLILPLRTGISVGGEVKEYVANTDTDPQNWDFELSGATTEVKTFTDILPVGVATTGAGLVVTFRVECKRRDTTLDAWRQTCCDIIQSAYEDQLRQYEEEVARLKIERGIAILGRADSENRQIEQRELKRAAIAILTSQQFDGFGAVSDSEIDFDKAAALGSVVQYFEQAFEWHNSVYVFYPYFWGRKEDWPQVLANESVDPLFTRFLTAGYARLQVPVRPDYATKVLYYLTSGKVWQDAADAPVARPYLPLVEEIRAQTGDTFDTGPGTFAVTQESPTLVGTQTELTAADIGREIRLAKHRYVIHEVVSTSQTITLDRPVKTATAAAVPYALGPLRVGAPWEMTLPTTLVMLDVDSVTLAEWPDE